MWELIPAYVVAGAGGAAVWFGLLVNRFRMWRWQAALEECGLGEGVSSVFWNPRMKVEARAESLVVRIERARHKGFTTLLTVEVPGPPGFSKVKIRREAHRPWGVREIEIGDESFDKAFFVDGPTQLVFALLDAHVRRRLLSANEMSRLEIARGELRAEMYDSEVSAVLFLFLDAGRRIARPIDLGRCLAANAQLDPEPGVRLRNLRLLARELPGDPQTLEILRTACSDPDPEVRLRAAIELGDEGRAILLALAEGVEDDLCSAPAVTLLGRELPPERLRAILIRALRWRRIQTALACLEGLGRHASPATVETLAKVLAREKGELAHAAAVALGATGSPAAEPPLILALQRESLDVRVAAADALARVGSAAAVLPLKEAAERSDDGELRRAARQAIAEIQSRVKGASPGQLSLTGAEAGQLSLARAEAGQLSLATEADAGQLSLAPDGPAPGDAA